jgi:hypothetical protein
MNCCGEFSMKIGFEASIHCRSCNPTIGAERDVSRLYESSFCESCVADVLTAASIRRASDTGAFLDPARQREIRRDIEAEYP